MSGSWQACTVRQSTVRWLVGLCLVFTAVYAFTVLDTYQHFASVSHIDSAFPFQKKAHAPVAEAVANDTSPAAPTRIVADKYVPPTLLDFSERCRLSGICDGNYTCGPDQLGCVTDPAARAQYVVNATRWAWAGYR